MRVGEPRKAYGDGRARGEGASSAALPREDRGLPARAEGAEFFFFVEDATGLVMRSDSEGFIGVSAPLTADRKSTTTNLKT